MNLYLVKPDLTYYEQYNEMMTEWCAEGTLISPWFLGEPFASIDEFADFVRKLDECEKGIVDKKYAPSSSYFVMDEEGRMVGATSLRHYLTAEGYHSWGHIGYGVRPSERRKGYAVRMLRMMLEKAEARRIYKVLIAAYDSNIGSWRTAEKCGGVLENIVFEEGDDKPIRRYWINVL
jgi:predicted acetyltransferase